MDRNRHKKHTGVDNQKILSNLKQLSKTDKEVILRIPVIPTVNDDVENIKATASFIVDEMLGQVNTLQLLSFMRLGEEKYESLGVRYNMRELNFDRVEFQNRVNNIAEYFNQQGIHCLVGTKEKQAM
jgi:pyruvate formate lyase activating enzyme